MKSVLSSLAAFFLVVAFASPGSANLGVEGRVLCDVNENGQLDIGVDTPLDVTVTAEGDLGFSNSQGTFEAFEDGYFSFALSLDVPQTYELFVEPSTIPAGASIIQPVTTSYMFTATMIGQLFTRNFLIDHSACQDEPEGACWMTAGGVKFSNITGGPVAEHGPRVNLGGNVFPSCDPDPGNGGQWNHVDHANQLHFQGFDIHTVACGNVPGIEEGSESPVTGFNFIEFAGTGLLRGIKGNHMETVEVSFFSRVEDRNEPGNEHASAGEDIERYYIHVFSDPADPFGTTLLLADEDGDAMTVDPLTITGGNLQLHQSSCE